MRFAEVLLNDAILLLPLYKNADIIFCLSSCANHTCPDR